MEEHLRASKCNFTVLWIVETEMKNRNQQNIACTGDGPKRNFKVHCTLSSLKSFPVVPNSVSSLPFAPCLTINKNMYTGLLH